MFYVLSIGLRLVSIVALLRIRGVRGGEPLSDWVDGIATNYGSSYDNMDPYSPSFGTKDVSLSRSIYTIADILSSYC